MKERNSQNILIHFNKNVTLIQGSLYWKMLTLIWFAMNLADFNHAIFHFNNFYLLTANMPSFSESGAKTTQTACANKSCCRFMFYVSVLCNFCFLSTGAFVLLSEVHQGCNNSKRWSLKKPGKSDEI